MAMPNYSQMSKEQLRAALAKNRKIVQDRGGPSAAPNYYKRVQAIRAALKGGDAGTGTNYLDNVTPQTPEQQVVKQTNKIDIDRPGSAVKAEQSAADLQATKNIGYFNPSQYGPYGSQVVTFDENGNPVLTTNLSPEQQALYEQGVGLSQQGMQFAQGRLQGLDQSFQSGAIDRFQNYTSGFNPQAMERLQGYQTDFAPELADRWSSGDLEADRARIEDEVFGRLTRGLDEDQTRALEAKKQELFNKGIPYSNDPNSRYQQEIGDINERFDLARTDARQRAVEVGGTEYSRAFGIGEQLRGNQLSEQTGIRQQNLGEIQNQFGLEQSQRQQNLSEIGQEFAFDQAARNQNLSELGFLANLGPGQQQGNYSPYQAPPAYDPVSPFAAFLGMQGLQDTDAQRELEKYLANLQASTSLQSANIAAGASKYATDAQKASQNPEDGVFVGGGSF